MEEFYTVLGEVFGVIILYVNSLFSLIWKLGRDFVILGDNFSKFSLSFDPWIKGREASLCQYWCF